MELTACLTTAKEQGKLTLNVSIRGSTVLLAHIPNINHRQNRSLHNPEQDLYDYAFIMNLRS